MEEKLKDYLDYKCMLSAIFRENGYIEKNCEENPDFENIFLNNNSLENLKLLILDNIFDDDKLNRITNTMEYFIKKYNNNKIIVNYCSEILEIIQKKKKKSQSNFYREQYNVRNQTSRKLVTKDMKEIIDKQIVIDIVYLEKLIISQDMDNPPINDINFLKSINLFISECPEIIYENSMNNYITMVLEENRKYKDNEELQKFNNLLLEYLNTKKEEAYELDYQIVKQTIFSLIFSNRVEAILKELKNTPNKEDFFNQEDFDIVCEYIIENKETCMMDSYIRNNVRELLFAFLEENKNLNMKYTLNELKIALNIYEDEKFKEKNLEFYNKKGKDYMYSMTTNDIKKPEDYKKYINAFINRTISFLTLITDSDSDYVLESADEYTPSYINYILNNFPVISNNRIFMERIEDILIANELWLEHNNAGVELVENYKIQKKVKKLCK